MNEKLTFQEYQQRALSTAVYPTVAVDAQMSDGEPANWIYPVLGLCGEAGEVAEKAKKIIRDKIGLVSDSDRAAIAKELGDVCWYLAAICGEFNLDLGEVAQGNLDKLSDRKLRGTLGGSGDNR